MWPETDPVNCTKTDQTNAPDHIHVLRSIPLTDAYIDGNRLRMNYQIIDEIFPWTPFPIYQALGLLKTLIHQLMLGCVLLLNKYIFISAIAIHSPTELS